MPVPISDQMDVPSARAAIRLACFGTLGIIGAGLLAIPVVDNVQYTMYSLFFEQYVKIEAPALLLVAAFAAVVLLTLRTAAGDSDIPRDVPQWEFKQWRIALLALALLVVVYAGIRLVFHGYLLADDEYSAWFQAQIFARGRAFATVPAAWCPYINALTPTSIVAGADCTWRLGFLPLHSLINAPFIAAGVGRLGGPVIAALSLCLVASIARKVWPDRPARAYLAALFFATSTQVMFMSMTFFSMPTHLLVSLVWLWLYVDNRRTSLLLLPWVGVIALGVHSPFPHGLFAAVFILRYLRDKRFAVFGYVAAVYLLGLSYWYGYMQGLSSPGSSTFASPSATAGVAAHLFSIPAAEVRLTSAMDLALIPELEWIDRDDSRCGGDNPVAAARHVFTRCCCVTAIHRNRTDLS